MGTIEIVIIHLKGKKAKDTDGETRLGRLGT
jgi:hypothetical protein